MNVISFVVKYWRNSKCNQMMVLDGDLLTINPEGGTHVYAQFHGNQQALRCFTKNHNINVLLGYSSPDESGD